MLKIIEKTKIWFSISIIILLIGMFFIIKDGLNYGIDFNGGTVVQINIGKDFKKEEVDQIIKKHTSDSVTNKVNNTQIEIKSSSLTDEEINKLFSDVKSKYNLKDKDLVSQQRIGPSVGKELKRKALLSLIIANIAMLIYVGIRFEFKFALAAILGLVHDVLVTISIYAIFRLSVNSSFIAAVLTIVGYSINDTIVIFDRIRENQKKMRRKDISEIANISITETMSRSINTVLTTLFTIVAVYVFVPSVRDFAFPLIVGIITGCYSSIFISSPLLVLFKKSKLGSKSA
ncbi:protein translocase subunit SecF [Clostridium sporogenes]|uniref:protein translocase subunit SecF n=1 Tax=Clostridium sporogenes TaxID=1509 RepID=UPI0013CF6BC9|nr:protein translocase subunit SecF [Clostridium sporogenes]EJP6472760.1 protein translocase subunit SecF [Clostridium botulinum]NFV12624.1 protein translocase subunit SecF [Clostridium sporogenes]